MVLGAGRLAAGTNDEEGEAKGQEHQHLFHDAAPACSHQNQWEKIKCKSRCQCHASGDGEGQGENYGYRHDNHPSLGVLRLPEQGKDFRDSHHVLELLGARSSKNERAEAPAGVGEPCAGASAWQQLTPFTVAKLRLWPN